MSSVGRKEFLDILEKKAALTPRKIQLIMLAYKLAKYGHKGQERDGGERYFEHPKRVALILIQELNIFDHSMMIAALLHDIKEDSFILDWQDIELIFGKKIKKMVNALTKKDKEKYPKKIRQASRKTKIVKLADRLDNARSLNDCTPEKQKKYKKETLELYLPLAQTIKGEIGSYLLSQLKKACENRKGVRF